jgi:phosphoribosylaminoimidazole-succinocarboxamide synthase
VIENDAVIAHDDPINMLPRLTKQAAAYLDSSRYWPAADYRPDCSPPSYDKQFVRDHLLAIQWNQQPPAPHLPADVIARTREKYLAALKNLLG